MNIKNIPDGYLYFDFKDYKFESAICLDANVFSSLKYSYVDQIRDHFSVQPVHFFLTRHKNKKPFMHFSSIRSLHSKNGYYLNYLVKINIEEGCLDIYYAIPSDSAEDLTYVIKKIYKENKAPGMIIRPNEEKVVIYL